jgi:hypothetical protein
MRGDSISLDPARLENVKRHDDGSIRAACPACRAAGSDKSGNHLKIEPGGKFGCATHKDDGEHRKEIFRLAGNRSVPRPANFASQAKLRNEANGEIFNWQKCVTAFTEADAQKLAAWRGLSLEIVRWIHAQGIVGIFDGKMAFANHGDGGKVVSAHVRLESGKWIFKPAGQKTAPLNFGNAKSAAYVLAFESQWDAFAVMDKLGWHAGNSQPDAAVFVTRGAGNGKLIRGQIAPDSVCYAFKQNDTPTAKNPIPAGDVWLVDVASNAGCNVLNVATPAPHKDVNDWTLAGATAADLQAAMKAGKLVKLPAVPVADSNHADIAREYLGGDETETKQAGLPPILDAADFLATPIDPPAELVAGILHTGSKLAFGGSSKSFKTWTLLDLAISVATGADWLGFSTAQGKVLFVNFEIQPHAWQQRIAAVARAKEITLKAGAIHLWNLRGHAADFKTLIPKIIERIRRESFALIILDPIYKLYGNTDENSAGNVALLLNSLEKLATETGAAIAFGAHFAKGNAASKEAIDRISGSGVFARDPDSLLIFTKHEAEDAFTIEPILRNFAPVAPFVARWNFPLMQLADDLDPAKLKQKPGRKQQHDTKKLLAAIADTTPKKPISISAWAKLTGIPRTSLNEYLTTMRRNKWIETIGEGSKAKQSITNEGKAFINETTTDEN